MLAVRVISGHSGCKKRLLCLSRPGRVHVPEIGAGEDGEMVVESVQRRIVFDARMSPETFRIIAFWMEDQVEHYARQVQEMGGIQ